MGWVAGPRLVAATAEGGTDDRPADESQGPSSISPTSWGCGWWPKGWRPKPNFRPWGTWDVTRPRGTCWAAPVRRTCSPPVRGPSPDHEVPEPARLRLRWANRPFWDE